MIAIQEQDLLDFCSQGPYWSPKKRNNLATCHTLCYLVHDKIPGGRSQPRITGKLIGVWESQMETTCVGQFSNNQDSGVSESEGPTTLYVPSLPIPASEISVYPLPSPSTPKMFCPSAGDSIMNLIIWAVWDCLSHPELGLRTLGFGVCPSWPATVETLRLLSHSQAKGEPP